MAAPTVATYPAVDTTKDAGKHVTYIVSASNTYSDAMSAGFTAAAKAAGLVPTVLNANRSVQTMNQYVQQAITQKPAAVVLAYISASLVKQPLDTLTAAGVPVVLLLTDGAQAPLTDGVYARVDFNADTAGKVMADWALADSGCSLSALFLDSPVYTSVHANQLAEQAEIKALCSACTTKSVQFNPATQATDIQRLVATSIQANPSIKYVFAPYDGGSVGFVEAGLKQINADAKIISIDGSAVNLTAMKSGTTSQVVDYAYAPAPYLGWLALNKVLQALAGMPGTLDVPPARLVDSTNIGDGNPDTIFSSLGDYQTKFKSLWGK